MIDQTVRIRNQFASSSNDCDCINVPLCLLKLYDNYSTVRPDWTSSKASTIVQFLPGRKQMMWATSTR